MNILNQPIVQVVIEILIFALLVIVGRFIFRKLRNSSNRFLNPLEFLPEDEVHTLKQVFYLIMMGLSFFDVFYSIIGEYEGIYYLLILDIVLSVALAITLDKTSKWNKLLFLLLVPYGAFTMLMFSNSVVSLLEFAHIFVFLYFVKVFYNKFNEYTRNNQLGITILLLFAIVFISFFITQFVEHVNPLDSLVMVSNAFTSNGYAILGSTVPGKINSLFLVWGGYIISGAGTATLTAALLIKYFNKRIRKLERIIEGEDDE